MRLKPLLLAPLLIAAQDTPGHRLAATVPVDATTRGKPTAMDGLRVALPSGVIGVSGVTARMSREALALSVDLTREVAGK